MRAGRFSRYPPLEFVCTFCNYLRVRAVTALKPAPALTRTSPGARARMAGVRVGTRAAASMS